MDVDELVGELLDAGYSGSYVGRIRCVAGQILRFGEREGILARNVVKLSDPVSFAPRDRSADELTIEEVVRFVDSCEGDAWCGGCDDDDPRDQAGGDHRAPVAQPRT